MIHKNENVAHIKNNFEDFKNFCVAFSPIPIVFGVAIQFYYLTKLDALAFFSWKQVVNDSVSLGGLFLAYAVCFFLFYQVTPKGKILTYATRLAMILFTPFFLYVVAAFSHYFETEIISSLKNSVILFIFILGFLIFLFLTFSSYKKAKEKILYYIKNKKGLLQTIWPSLYFVFLCLYSAAIIFMTSTLGSIFTIKHYTKIFVVNNKVYVSDYFNDSYVFSRTKNNQTLIFRSDVVKNISTIPIHLSSQEGPRIPPIDSSFIQKLSVDATTIQPHPYIK